ncbi:hypothetical protein ACFRMN_35100 [Streptomyces sp. NPDC056835]|uniref:hypothetical protein n=1 Tax=Streptomyces sp. NPDC056835 TaxID=3345956 RepID=UPI0036C3401F
MPRTAYRLVVASLLALAAVIAPVAIATADDAPQTATVTTDAGWGSTPANAPEPVLAQDDAGWG